MKKFILYAALFLVVPISSCCHTSQRDLYPLGQDLLYLTAAVKAKVQEIKPPANMPDSDELLTLSTQHDPSLLAPFKPYRVRIRVEGENVTLLVCTKDRKTGLLEDRSCTPELDKRLWEKKPPVPCEFTVYPDVCK